MTDNETLLAYRLREAEETLADARTLLENHGSLRTVVNRAYYAAFYSVLAFFIKAEVDVRTSKHAGVIALFDKEAVHAGRLAVDIPVFCIDCLKPGSNQTTRNLFSIQRKKPGQC